MIEYRLAVHPVVQGGVPAVDIHSIRGMKGPVYTCIRASEQKPFHPRRRFFAGNWLCSFRGRILFKLDLHSAGRDRKSTRLNSSHVAISYAVFCLKKKKEKKANKGESRCAHL